MIMLMLSAFAQDIPTVCQEGSPVCTISKDRLATITGRIETLEDELESASNTITDVTAKLKDTTLKYESDGRRILEQRQTIEELRTSNSRLRRQRNTAYAVTGAAVLAISGGIYLGTKL